MIFRWVLFLLLSFPICFVEATPRTTAKFNQLFREIIIDVRESRGGNGDVASGYLMAMELLRNKQISGFITILVDDKSKKILSRLAQGNLEFWSRVKVETMRTLPDGKVFDLYLALASPSGDFIHKQDIIELEGLAPVSYESPQKIKLKSSGVLIVQTVLGNTENTNYKHPNALVRTQGINYEMSVAGLGLNEGGIYNDYVALHLKHKTLDEVRQFIMGQSDLISDLFSRMAVEKIIGGKKLQGAQIGLAYGISLNETKKQFESYLRGLVSNNETGYCLITPSKVDEGDISDPNIRAKVKFVTDLDSLPDTAEAGKIYIVKTGTLPHSVFVGLMAYSMKSGQPPIGAGDGFMSAAINLGEPFVLTRVEWNAQNIQNLKDRLIDIAHGVYIDPIEFEFAVSLVSQVFDQIDFNDAKSLVHLRPLFAQLSELAPALFDRIINAAVAVSAQTQTSHNHNHKYDEDVLDPMLRSSLKSGGLRAQINFILEAVNLIQKPQKLAGEANQKQDLLLRQMADWLSSGVFEGQKKSQSIPSQQDVALLMNSLKTTEEKKGKKTGLKPDAESPPKSIKMMFIEQLDLKAQSFMVLDEFIEDQIKKKINIVDFPSSISLLNSTSPMLTDGLSAKNEAFTHFNFQKINMKNGSFLNPIKGSKRHSTQCDIFLMKKPIK